MGQGHGRGRRRRRRRHRHRRRPARLPDLGHRPDLARDRQRGRQPDTRRPPATGSATARTSRASSPATACGGTRTTRPTAASPARRPDANLISIKAGDDNGDATVLDVIYGIEFAIEHKDEFNIRVLNLSLQSTSAESYKTDPLDAAVEAAWFSGITVVAAVGNRGNAADAVNYAPGNDPYVISVGGIDDSGTKNDRRRRDRRLVEPRRRRRTASPSPRSTPPGAHILSTLAPNSAFASMCPTLHLRRQLHQGRRQLDGGADRRRHRRRHRSSCTPTGRPTWSRARSSRPCGPSRRTRATAPTPSLPSELDADRAVKAEADKVDAGQPGPRPQRRDRRPRRPAASTSRARAGAVRPGAARAGARPTAASRPRGRGRAGAATARGPRAAPSTRRGRAGAAAAGPRWPRLRRVRAPWSPGRGARAAAS